MTIEGDYSLFCHLETGLPRRARAPHADRAQRARGRATRPAASRSSTSPPATTTIACRPATATPRTSRARSASRPTRRPRGGAAAGIGTVPHGLIAAYGGDTVRAAQALRRTLGARDEHRRAGRLRERLRPHRARGRRARSGRGSGACGSTRRTTMVDRSLWPQMGRFDPRGVNPQLVRNVREALDREGFPRVRIVVSGGFTAAKIRASRRPACRSTPTASAPR